METIYTVILTSEQPKFIWIWVKSTLRDVSDIRIVWGQLYCNCEITVSIFLLFWACKYEHTVSDTERNKLCSTLFTGNIAAGHAWNSVQDLSKKFMSLAYSPVCCFWNVYKCKQILSIMTTSFKRSSEWKDNMIIGESPRSKAFLKAGVFIDFLFCCGEGSSMCYQVLHLKS